MSEFIQIFPTIYFIVILFLYWLNNYLNFSKRELVWVLLSLYFGWALFLGLRNVYDDITLDPYTFHYQAKNLSIEELWSENFPKIDILLQLIMKLYFAIINDDIIVMVLTETTIIGLIFIGVLYFTSFNPNALLLTISFLVFTNTGILLTANFLRQGLAIAVFLNILNFLKFLSESNTSKNINVNKLLSMPIMAIVQLFSHISSLYLLFCLLLAEMLEIKRLYKPSFSISMLLFFTISIVFGHSIFSTTNEIYSGYEGAFYDEGITKLYSKLSIDAIALLLLIIFRKVFLKNQENIQFNLLLKTCIFLLISCIIYSYVPVIALRMEYYLNFLIIIVLASLVSSKSISTKVIQITMFLTIISMYIFSFTVYEHPSLTRVLVF